MAAVLVSASPHPSDETCTAIPSLNKLQDAQFTELSSTILNYLTCDNKRGNLTERIQAFGESHGINAHLLRNSFKSLTSVINGSLQLGLKAESVAENLITVGLSEDKAHIVSAQYTAAAERVPNVTSTSSPHRLLDIDWKFGVTAASSELDKVGNTFIQLKLTIGKESTVDKVCMELTLPQFYDFLHEMQKARASLEYFN